MEILRCCDWFFVVSIEVLVIPSLIAKINCGGDYHENADAEVAQHVGTHLCREVYEGDFLVDFLLYLLQNRLSHMQRLHFFPEYQWLAIQFMLT